MVIYLPRNGSPGLIEVIETCPPRETAMRGPAYIRLHIFSIIDSRIQRAGRSETISKKLLSPEIADRLFENKRRPPMGAPLCS